MALQVISIIIFGGVFVSFWVLIRGKKRTEKYIRWLSLISLCPVIICSIIIADELAQILVPAAKGIIIQSVILFLLIYGFRLFQEFAIKRSRK